MERSLALEAGCAWRPRSRGEDQPRSFFRNSPLKIPAEFRRALRGFRQWQLPWRCRQCSARAVKGRHAVRLKLAPLSDEERIARRMRRRNLGRAGNGSRESDVPSRSVTTGAPHSIRFQAARFADYVFRFGEVVFFLRRRERDGRVEACDADDGAVEIVESFFVDDGGDLAGEASGAGVFVEDDDFVCLLYGCCDGFAI